MRTANDTVLDRFASQRGVGGGAEITRKDGAPSQTHEPTQ